MSRKGSTKKRVILPDPKFHDKLMAKFINKVMLQGKKSDLENVDTGQSILNLTMMNNVYTASLLVTSKSLQTSLMDFLR